jgi:hypothetical protein
MHRPSAKEFLLTLLETLEDLPPELGQRLAEILDIPGADRSQAIRALFEELARD